MVERLLCDDVARVTLGVSGGRLLIGVEGEIAVRFQTAAEDLDEAIETRTPLQLSVHGSYCRLQVDGDRVHVAFAVGDSGRKTCEFPLGELVEAIALAREG